VGPGWIAGHGSISGWEVLNASDVQSVAIVPPSRARQVTFLRSPTLPKPSIAIKDRFGRVLSINVVKFPSGASKGLVPQLPADTNVTPAASLFLSSGGLPGQWGKKVVMWKGID